MTTQPEALRLANYIEKCDRCGGTKAAAYELRRLHAENEAQAALLRQALEALEDVDGIDTATEVVVIDVGDTITAISQHLESKA